MVYSLCSEGVGGTDERLPMAPGAMLMRPGAIDMRPVEEEDSEELGRNCAACCG